MSLVVRGIVFVFLIWIGIVLVGAVLSILFKIAFILFLAALAYTLWHSTLEHARMRREERRKKWNIMRR
ncbi:hypothetical protein [Ferroacidibacillus organovorans]|uniref:Uncharacterized protein n=1 Tax=Ferroacidibacillus organovorans TaxID=1765683 RepID=A0A162SRY7_9BACL|nr:hypothetical protein [Ferroacidibacillus organovorans]KYP80094.1 hypothetical protein AYJ22_12405 [Ferroacidibacillus organovorans]OAG93125.1 hypothetical protein AYW79_12275 [Ferroacidibacillus organovorans]OPG15560.1 hypothetical protein B2M26_10815 [Ferroacidibacillus organovorans]